MRAYKVYAIKNGTVIDHIPEGKGIEIIDLLNLKKWKKTVTLGIGFNSKRYKRKDVVKVENKELTPEEVNKIAIIAPTATLNIIRDFKLVKKAKLELPDVITGIIKCANPACITNNEPVKTKFSREPGKKLRIQCNYCERYFDEEDISLI